MITILHLITDLDIGGAETFLCRLVEGIDRCRFRNVVVALNGDGPVADKIRNHGVEVYSLSMARGTIDVRALPRLIRILRRERPDLLQTWLYHADMLGLIAGKLVGIRRIAFNLRCSNMDMRYYPKRTARLRRMLALVSRLPDAIIINSIAGKFQHQRLGFRPRRWQVIENGIDTNRFRPDARARENFRSSLGVNAATPVIGVIARYDSMKDHENFFRAATGIAEARIVLVGRGMVSENRSLAAVLTASGMQATLLGERDDIPAVLSGLDFLCMPSAFGEGFPNAVAEAMACGVPCIATDVGDASRIIGDCGIVVPPSDSEALGDGLRLLVGRSKEDRQHLGERARERIANEFHIDHSVARYEAFYTEIVHSG